MYNRVILIGRLTKDPEYRSTPEGVTLARMGLAVNRTRSRESTEEQTDFIDMVAWRQQAEFAINYLKKGRLVMVEGRLQVRSWLSPQGERRRTYEVVVDRIQPLERAREPVGVADEPMPPVGDTPAPVRNIVSTDRAAPGVPSDPFLADAPLDEEDYAYDDTDPFADTEEA